MRKLTDLLAGEPLALTGAITATGNLLFLSGAVTASPELIASLNVAVGAWFGVLRWLVVPTAVATKQASDAETTGYSAAVADISQLAPAKPKKATKKAG